MAGHVEFYDFSVEVKDALDDTIKAWIIETAGEVASKAKRGCVMEDDKGKQLKNSYAWKTENDGKKANVGSPLESAYWEEWGTGEYAAHGDGRKGWWIYTPGQISVGDGATYETQEEAERMAAYIRARYNKQAIVTNGRMPNYTLEKAFEQTKNPATAELKRRVKERMGGK